MTKLIIHTDGGARGNPGPAGAGAVITDSQGQQLFAGGFYLGKATNNVAEYEGLLRGLIKAEELGGTELEIRCDSELIVKQVNGQYRVKDAKLRPLYEQVARRMQTFPKAVVRHVYRSDNAHADEWVNRAIDAREDVADDGHQEPLAAAAMELTTRDLRQQAEALGARGGKVTLIKHKNLCVELLAVRAKDTLELTGTWGQATLTVMRGQGTLGVDGREEVLSPGIWLHVDRGAVLRLHAQGDSPLVIILTWLR